MYNVQLCPAPWPQVMSSIFEINEYITQELIEFILILMRSKNSKHEPNWIAGQHISLQYRSLFFQVCRLSGRSSGNFQ